MLKLRTQSFCRYRVPGGVPSPWGEAFHRLLTERRFLPLAAEEERTYGWVSADNLLVTEFHVGRVMRGDYAAFALRVDRRRVNARLLRAQVDLEVGARLDALREGGEPARLGREERRALREDLRRDLLRQTSPTVDATTVLYHPKRRVLHVLSLARSVNELVRLHIRDTFGVDPILLTPWQRSVELLGARARDGDDLRPALEDLRRADFGRPLAVPAATARGGLR